MDDQLLDRALRAYARALAVADPIRIPIWEERGLTMPQLRLAFILLYERDGAAVSELAERLRVNPSTVTGFTDRLARQRLVDRRRDPEDGRRVLQGIDVASRAYMYEIFRRLGPERLRALIDLLEELAEAAAQAENASVTA